MRGVLQMANGVSPVYPNPDFTEQLKKIAASGKGLIIYCETGGSLAPSANFPTGKQSRSLEAVYTCHSTGITKKVAHLAQGVYGYYKAGGAMEGEYTGANAGRTPGAALEAKIDEKYLSNKQ